MDIHFAYIITFSCLSALLVPVTPEACEADPTTEERIRVLEETLESVTRQMMMQQFYVEEQTRSDGNSGLKRVRTAKHGPHPYDSASHVDDSIASIHNHANLDRTLGMGEVAVVLNGVEFRTRHNDYLLNMKSRFSTEYGMTEEIPLPEVPPEVLQYSTVEDQTQEMQEWFRAFRDQDHSLRDYRLYFKPVLCYLEGMWTHADQQQAINEPFQSDRHFIDAKSWLDLQEKIRFTSYAGTKDGQENFAYLPTAVFSMTNDSRPVFVQWNFRILCHPLSVDVPLAALRPVDDLKTRISHGLSFDQYVGTREARFQVSDSKDRKEYRSMLDDLMSEIPGQDNYPGHIEDTMSGYTVYPFRIDQDPAPLNTAYYHRIYRLKKPGDKSLKIRRRGFADVNMFLAQTSSPKVAGLPVEFCEQQGDCSEYFQRWSYAIPLEIVYLTPLTNWNPYGIEFKGHANRPPGRTVYKGPNGRRNGDEHPDLAYNGTNSKTFYRTPKDFFLESTHPRGAADTAKEYTCVLDSNGEMRQVRPSGHRIVLPPIDGVGEIRQRFPIMPLHGEGSGVWKELDALKELVLRPSKYGHMFRGEIPITSLDPNHFEEQQQPGSVHLSGFGPREYITGPSSADFGSHTHHFHLSEGEVEAFLLGDPVDVVTEQADGHHHMLVIQRVFTSDGVWVNTVTSCDGEAACWDGHPSHFDRVLGTN